LNLIKNIQKTAKNTLLQEAKAIEEVASYIDGEFEEIVELILSMKGRLVVTGIGKSALIGNKIVATMNSTGTPSLFMHAADAIHGDLGMLQQDDVVICISKSGNTPEIKVVVPLLKRTGAKLVALVSNMDSFLAKQSDFILNATMKEEADPNNLAPTTSTTVHMALGDALAISLLEARGFTSEDFARYHPGGSLGKQLYLKVDDIYPKNELPIIDQSVKVKAAILVMSKNRLGATAVVNLEDKLIGVFTDGDLRRMLEKHDNYDQLEVHEVMTKNPITIEKGDYAVRALNIMRDHDISQIIVMEKDNIVGFIHFSDLLNEGIV